MDVSAQTGHGEKERLKENDTAGVPVVVVGIIPPHDPNIRMS
jgi:hypothetical protein